MSRNGGKKKTYEKYGSPLERGWNRRKLVRELAQMEKTQTQLAEEYGVTQSAISQFATRHRAEIDEVKDDIENEFAGLWIANKADRLATYQEQAEQLAGTDDPACVRAVQNALRQVAEELGHIPNRVTLGGEVRTVNYRIDGANPQDLR